MARVVKWWGQVYGEVFYSREDEGEEGGGDGGKEGEGNLKVNALINEITVTESVVCQMVRNRKLIQMWLSTHCHMEHDGFIISIRNSGRDFRFQCELNRERTSVSPPLLEFEYHIMYVIF
jgi:hypothetical protein